MTHSRTVTLRRDVAVRPLTPEQAPAMFGWMGDPVVSRNLGLSREPSLEKTAAWIQNALQADSLTRPFAVFLNDAYVGNVVLDSIDRYLDRARLSIYIGEPSARRSGVGSTALYLVLKEGFDTLELHKIWLTVHTRNHTAINTYLRLGFGLEGILRDEFRLDGHWADVFYMGLLSEEFRRIVVS